MYLKAITTQEENNIPIGTDEVVHISCICIPPTFGLHPPKEYKIKRAIRYFVRNNTLDEPINVIAEVNENGKQNKLVIADGYARYLALVEWIGFRYVPVKYIEFNK